MKGMAQGTKEETHNGSNEMTEKGDTYTYLGESASSRK